MPEELLTNMTLSPLVLIAAGVCAAVVFFFIGWIAKGSGANSRENELKRDILEAKRSIPQLESDVRNRDHRIARLEEELSELNDRTIALGRETEAKERELKGAEREAKNLTSEIAAIRGLSGRDDGNVLMDGFDDERAAPAEGESALQAQLKKTESLYEKLKGALISRDEEIEALKAKLESAASTLVSDQPAPAGHALADPDEDDDRIIEAERALEAQKSVVADLQNQITELNKEKVMLEELASRRSKSNRALKTASAEAEARIPQLEQEIANREQTISDREASIKRLVDDLDSTRRSLSEREAELHTSAATLAAKEMELAAVAPKLEELNEGIRQRESRIENLDLSLAQAQATVEERAAELKLAREHLSEQEEDMAATQAQLREQEQAAAALKNSIKDRDFRIEDLESQILKLKESLTSAEQSATDTLALSDKRHAVVAAEVDDAQQQVTTLKRELEDLKSQLEQRDQWMAKLKESLSDREQRVNEQQERADQLIEQLDAANQRLAAMDDTRQQLESQKHELERELVAATTRTEQAEAALEEQVQSVNLYKNMIADRDFRIESLESDLAQNASAPQQDADGDKPANDSDEPDTPAEAAASGGSA